MKRPALMYHEIERPGRPMHDPAPSYTRYVVREADFAQQLDRILALGLRGIGVEAARQSREPAVILTFDDGCATDEIVAAPLLGERGFGATFYVTTGFTGQRGYMDAAALRRLIAGGFEIGSHGASHRFLTELPDSELRRELVESRERLADWVGRPVVHLSCPGGRCDPRVRDAAVEAGYTSIATSRPGVNQPGALEILRTAITRDMPVDGVAAICLNRGQGPRRFRAAVLDLLKRTLGSSAYERIRGRLLASKPDRHSHLQRAGVHHDAVNAAPARHGDNV